MRPHILAASKKNESPSMMLFFDSESWVKTEITEQMINEALAKKVEIEHKLYLICGCLVKRTKKGFKESWNDYYISGMTEETWTKEVSENLMHNFWTDIDRLIPSKKKISVFAHNAKYDVLVTGAVPELIKLGYKVVAFSDSNPFFIKFTKFKEDELGIPHAEKTISIVSSTNYYQFTLAKLGECFNIPKMEVDYETVSVDEAVPYCRNDVLILKVAMMEFMKFIQEEDLGNFMMTIAGQSFTAFRHRFMKHDIYIHKSPDCLKLEREAYAGGRNECWRIGNVDEKVFYLDVNSMYPYVMKNFKYPTKLVTCRKYGELKDIVNFIDRGYYIIAKVKLRTDKRIYFKKAGKLIFPVGEFITTLSTPELIRAIKDDHIIEVIEFNVYENDYLFVEYVDYFYGKRLDAKRLKDEVRVLLYKLFLNSLYGKFGQKNNNYEKVAVADPEIVEVERIYDVDNKKEYQVKTFGGTVFKKETLPDGYNDAFDAFPAVAAHVTSYARMLLYSYIEIAGYENIFYMDTDSIFCNEEGYKRLLVAGCCDEYELGKLKLEETKKEKRDKETGEIISPAEFEAAGVEIKGCKDYKFYNQDKAKIKGISKNSVYLGKDTDGYDQYISTVWRGFSKAITEGNLAGYKNELMIKKLKREYDKGDILENGYVVPFIYINDKNEGVN